MHGRSNLARGFTLLELVVAMAMVAILAVSLFASLRIAFKMEASAEAAIEPGRTADLALEFIRNDLQNAFPPTTGVNATLAGTFEGTVGSDSHGKEAGDLVFFSTAEMREHPSANGEIKKIELTVATPQGGNQQCLIRRCLRNLTAQIDPAPDEEILCRGIDGFTLRYFDGANWTTTWDSTQYNNALPAAVEVTLTLDRSTPQQQRTLTYVRIFQLPCSTAATDDTSQDGGITQ